MKRNLVTWGIGFQILTLDVSFAHEIYCPEKNWRSTANSFAAGSTGEVVQNREFCVGINLGKVTKYWNDPDASYTNEKIEKTIRAIRSVANDMKNAPDNQRMEFIILDSQENARSIEVTDCPNKTNGDRCLNIKAGVEEKEIRAFLETNKQFKLGFASFIDRSLRPLIGTDYGFLVFISDNHFKHDGNLRSAAGLAIDPNTHELKSVNPY